ncbi:hypothetical protein [Xanthomonas graminis]|uniref:hypothetical protein n=1 Tax=Xanthomonas graminis TaxID=3390026 RepID=UPI00253FB387|nr:hypothetical protein [Xanthomonas translucens]
MTAAPPSDGAVAPPALAAFLRGIERRAAVLAELQSGSVERGAPALAAAMRAFRSHAATLPMADWPLHFWKLLAAVPSLRQIVTAARSGWPLPLAHLGKLTAADRLALLLRIVAGLDEPTAAQVLNQSTQDYQQARITSRRWRGPARAMSAGSRMPPAGARWPTPRSSICASCRRSGCRRWRSCAMRPSPLRRPRRRPHPHRRRRRRCVRAGVAAGAARPVRAWPRR